MKKITTVLLAVALIATLSLASFAATVNTVPGAESKDYSVGYTAMTPAGTVYSVDIEWDTDLAFDYSAGTQGAWNADEHKYSATTGAGWTDNTSEVKVTNHSNAALVASIAIVDAAENDGVTVTADAASKPLATAVNTAADSAPSVTFTLTASGTPTASIAKVATATVSLAAGQ